MGKPTKVASANIRRNIRERYSFGKLIARAKRNKILIDVGETHLKLASENLNAMGKANYPTQEQWTLEAFDFLKDVKELLSVKKGKNAPELIDRLNDLLNNYETAREIREEERERFDSQVGLIDTSMYHDLSTL